MVSASETVSVAVVLHSFGNSSSWGGYCYRCYTQSLGLLFSGFWVSLVLLWHLVHFCGQGTYCLARTPGCYVITAKMAFWLSSKVVVLHLDNSIAKVYAHLIKVVYCTSFSFQTSLLHFESGWQVLLCKVVRGGKIHLSHFIYYYLFLMSSYVYVIYTLLFFLLFICLGACIYIYYSFFYFIVHITLLYLYTITAHLRIP